MEDVFTLSFLNRVWEYAIRCREDSAKIVGMWVSNLLPQSCNECGDQGERFELLKLVRIPHFLY